MQQQLRIHRRHFLVGAGGTVIAASVGGSGVGWRAHAQEAKQLPDYADWKNADALIVHSDQTVETKRGFIGPSIVTSNDVLYIRNNLAPPGEEILGNRDAWQLSVEGVANPRSLPLGELKRLALETVATVLQCSGNGRALFDHEASGTQWTTGAAGCVLWSGVPIRALAQELGGVQAAAKFLTGTGGETIPEGLDPKEVIVERSVPLAAMDTAILAWEMNGEPIPLAHGGPLRMIVPGYYGINNVKYVKRIAFTETETDAKIQATGYRVRPVGVEGAPDQPSMWEMKTKSWVTHPLKDAATGRIQIYGIAFGGINPLQKVEVSTDGGKSWQEAAFTGPDLGRFAWRVFVFPTELSPGTYTITSRATDTQGNVQSETTEPNHRGYDYSGWSRLAVEVTVA